MTTVAPAKSIATYASEFEALTSDDLGPAWLEQARKDAWNEFEKIGFPTARRGNELWKYTDLRRLDSEAFNLSFEAGEVSEETLKASAPWDDDWHSLVIVDGKFVPELSRNLDGDGLNISTIVGSASENQRLKEQFGKPATVEGNAFVALNTALFSSGALIEVADNAELDQPVHLLRIITEGEDNRAFYPRTLLLTGTNSSVTVIESFINLSSGPQFTVPVFEVSPGEGSNVQHFRVQLENEKSIHIGYTRTEQPADAVFNSSTFATGPAIGRNDVHTNLAEEGAETTLHGLYITDGDSHQDNEISTTHQKPHGTSHQFYKGILAGKSRAVFSGKVVVQEGAMKTLAEQKDLNLLLSHGAEIDTKPSLEIYADDVKCAHGATAGHVDQAMLFYLMSRGVSREEAAMMLITGFASEIVDEFEPEPLQEFLYRKLEEIIPQLESEGIL